MGDSFLFTLEDGDAEGLPGTAVRTEHDGDGDFEGTNIYFSSGDGTNSLFISGADLGFGEGGDIDGIDIPFVAPPPPSSGTGGGSGQDGPQGPEGPAGPASSPGPATPVDLPAICGNLGASLSLVMLLGLSAMRFCMRRRR